MTVVRRCREGVYIDEVLYDSEEDGRKLSLAKCLM